MRAALESTLFTYYEMYGLHVASCLALPGLPWEGTSTPDVVIRYGPVPDRLAQPQAQGVLYQARPDCFLFAMDGRARYLIRNGNEIIVEPAPGVDEDTVRLLLQASPFGALLHQRGMLALHGSAVVVNGQTVVFVGESGAGKSTLAAAFRQRGYALLADDVSVVVPSHETLRVLPGYPQLKLWDDVVHKLGESPHRLQPLRPGMAKYGLSCDAAFCREPRPLSRLYVLCPTNASTLTLTPLQGLEKLTALVEHTYRRGFLDGLGRKASHFTQCAAVARQTAVFRVTRPLTPFLLDELVHRLEQEWEA